MRLLPGPRDCVLGLQQNIAFTFLSMYGTRLSGEPQSSARAKTVGVQYVEFLIIKQFLT